MSKCSKCGEPTSQSLGGIITESVCPSCLASESILTIGEKPSREEDPGGEELGDEESSQVAFEMLLEKKTPRVFVVPVLVVLNFLVFLAMSVSGVSLMDPTVFDLLSWGANFDPLIAGGDIWRLLTATFVHIGIIHIAINMYVLWDVGKLAERLFGNWPFLFLYIACGLGGSIASVAWNPLITSAGASGAIFGVAGGLLAFMQREKLGNFRDLMKGHLNNLLVFVGYNLFFGFTASGIDNAGHIGGLLSGMIIGFFLARPLELTPAARPPRYRIVVPLTVILLLALSLTVPKLRAPFTLASGSLGLLSWASLGGLHPEVITLINKGVDVNGADMDGVTPLMWAAAGGHADIVRTLLNRGADADARDAEGASALMIVAQLGKLDVAKALLEGGANPNLKDNSGRAAIHYAAVSGQTEMVVELLKQVGAEE